MIRKRPRQHLDLPEYNLLQPGPYALHLEAVPDLIKMALLTLGGVQPFTLARSEAAGGLLSDALSPEEVEFYRNRHAKFQLIMVVINSVVAEIVDGIPRMVPYSVSLIPSSKRGAVSHSEIDFVSEMNKSDFSIDSSAYVGLDPFVGDWTMWGEAGLVVGDKTRPGFMDELGLVYDHYFLDTDFQPDSIAMLLPDMPESAKQRYFKHRSKLLFKPFQDYKSRRVWGCETAIELFVFQELVFRRCPIPQPQVIILEDGTSFACLYDAWDFFENEGMPGLITEADFFFEQERVVVFCDGAQHSRLRNRARDAAIDAKLSALGFLPVRLPSKLILRNISLAVDMIVEALESSVKTSQQ